MKKNKKILKKASVGMSLLMSSVLLCGNTVKAHAQADLTPEESQKLTEFLATQPTNGARTSLGLTNNVSHSTYKFKGVNNYTSIFESRATKVKLDKDYEFTFIDGDHAGETVHVKNWQDLECFDLSTAENHPDPSMGKFYFAKEVTFVTNDGTEFTERNVALPVEADGIERYDITAYPNRYAFDYPIEEADSRFTSDIGPTSDMAISGANGYWQLFATVNEEIPYDTIAEIDENLKQGEIVEVTQGEIGNKIGTFNFTIADDLGSRYLDYDADVIYNDLKDLFSTSSIQKDAFFVRDYGLVTYVEGGSVDPKTRVLHVGIDYTQYVTEDGTELKTKEYGVHDKETFNGYEFVETRTAENGDTVHVYKKVTTPTPEPEQPETPTDPTPTQPETPTNPVEETPVVPNPTPEPETPGNNGNTPVEPSNPDNSGNINGDNGGETTPGNPSDNNTPGNPTPEVPNNPTPNPTPEPTPEVPNNPTPENPVEDNTPVVPNNPTPNPTPEPNVPVEETPSQPVNPTPEPEKPTVVEEKPVNNNTGNQTYSEQKIEDKGGTPPTGDNLFVQFTTFLTTAITGMGTLVIRNKMKED